MYLRKLYIKGFKSFADPTELNLLPGLTMIVGPNGCGKSNVVDAVRWAVGESNVRQLRGQKNEDVIFNGTDSKKAQGMAWVEMLLDNSKGQLPIDFAEISVGRKIYRSGDSEFLLNKTKVRLKDINQLFAGTGLGRQGYSIIGQGELEAVLNGTPLDRRLILEEASGVIIHRQQRDEVKRRIGSTSENMVRVADILAELDTRQNELKVKAERAGQYLSYDAKYRELEQELLSYEISSRRQEIERKQGDEITITDEIARIKEEMRALKLKLEESQSEAEKLRARKAALDSEYHDAENSVNTIQSEIRVIKERLVYYGERTVNASVDGQKYREMLIRIQQDIDLAKSNYDQAAESCQERESSYNHMMSRVNELNQRLMQNKADFEQKKTIAFDEISREAGFKNAYRSSQEQIRVGKEKKERIILRLEACQADGSQLQAETESLTAKITEYENLLLKSLAEKKELDQAKSVYLQTKEELEQSINEARKRHIRLQQQLGVLEDMDKNLTGYSGGVKFVLQPGHAAWFPGVLGVVGRIIMVQPGLETAIEVALGRNIDNIVMLNSKQAENAITMLKNKQGGRVTFLPLDMLKPVPVPDKAKHRLLQMDGVLGVASRLVDYEADFAPVIEYLLGRILVVENMLAGIKVFKQGGYPLKIVTREGEVINAGGAMTGGNTGSQNKSPLKMKAQIQHLHKSISEIQAQLYRQEEEYSRTRRILQDYQDKAAAWQESRSRYEFELELYRRQSKECLEKINRNEEDSKRYQTQLAQIEQEIAANTLSGQELLQTLQEAEERNRVIHNEIEAQREKIEAGQLEYEVNQEKLRSIYDQLQMKGKEMENNRRNLQQLRQMKDSYHSSWQESVSLLERMNRETESETLKLTELEQRLNENSLRLGDIHALIRQILPQEQDCHAMIKNLSQQVYPRQEQLDEAQTRLKNLELSQTRQKTELDNIKMRWEEKYPNMPLRDLQPGFGSAQVRAIKNSMNELQTKIESLGPVNVDSINEYEEISERYLFMHKQYRDLLEAKASLEQMVAETEKLMEKQFMQFMDSASTSFSHTFQEIFGGGEARMVLLESKDTLEAGVDIEIKLPGKKMQPLNLLSGGERALTCIAFIFGLLYLKPVPFCFLDEIDASLDEINLARFVKFLQKFAQEIQFIVITHRQTMIAGGNNIYGVTMPEKGVSAVLSLSLDQAESIAG